MTSCRDSLLIRILQLGPSIVMLQVLLRQRQFENTCLAEAGKEGRVGGTKGPNRDADSDAKGFTSSVYMRPAPLPAFSFLLSRIVHLFD